MESNNSMENIHIWKIKESEFIDDLILEIDSMIETNNTPKYGTNLLDMNKTTYSILEKYVYDIASFHSKRLNIKGEYFVEFWTKKKIHTHVIHVDCDENLRLEKLEYEYPLLSTVTYLNDSNIPTVISNIDMDRFMYKDFEKDICLFFSFPKKHKQISFDGKYYHGSAILHENEDFLNEDRYIIAINIWDKRPLDVEYYNNNDNNTCKQVKMNYINIEKDELQENTNLSVIGLDKDVMNYKLFENILYDRDNNFFTIFGDIINTQEITTIHNYKIFLDETIEVKKLEMQLKTKYGNVLDDIKELMEQTDTIKYNRFLQRFIYPKIYCPNVCSWIINECENYAKDNGGWTKKRHKNYPTTDLPVDSVKSIFGFVFESLKLISEKIKKSYGLMDEINIDFSDLFIVKYKHDDQNFLEIHRDGSFLSFNILLSDPHDFEGGGTYFDDGLIMKGEQGDLIVHSSKMKHSGLPITRGTRYLLVGFVNIQIAVDKLIVKPNDL
jgi:hypothetical protein